MKKIALFGGSFNPPHLGHFEMAKYIYENLRVDEVWFLFSYNALKDRSSYASDQDRIKMGHILLKEFPDMPFVMSNIQNDLGTHRTYDVLEALRKRQPNDRFIWIMGADNLSPTKPDGSPNNSYFGRWENYDKIMENYSIAVVGRPGFMGSAQKSPIALAYEFLRASNPSELISKKHGWCFLDNPQIDISSSALLEALRTGQKNFDPRFSGVVDYIYKNRLYGVTEIPQHTLN